jgi:hypothetical protein
MLSVASEQKRGEKRKRLDHYQNKKQSNDDSKMNCKSTENSEVLGWPWRPTSA